jgi:SAM-dependent methyltransferase
VLDLGAGTGQTVAAVRARFPVAAVVAVDVSAGMLGRLRARYAGVRTRCADAVDYLRRSTEVFDLVTSVGMLEVVPDLPLVVRLVARRLAAGGSVVATYEPVVSGLGEQAERRNLSRGRRPDGAEVAIAKHRWHVGEVAAAFAGAGLAVREHRLSVAYVNSGTPVVYGAVWAAAGPAAASGAAAGQES